MVMSWKPSRSSGLMFDHYTRNANKAREQIDELISSGNYIHFEYLNRFSKAFYLYWLNDSKAMKAMYSKNTLPFDLYCHVVYLDMFKRNITLIYKPLQKLLQSNENN